MGGTHPRRGKLLLQCHGGCNLKRGVDHLSSGVSVSGVGLVAGSIFLELSVSWGSASRFCSNIGRSLPGSPWSIMKLTNTRRPLKEKHNRNDNETKKRVRIGYCFAKVHFFSLNKNIPTSRTHLPSLRWERRTMADASAFLKTVREKGIQRRVK